MPVPVCNCKALQKFFLSWLQCIFSSAAAIVRIQQSELVKSSGYLPKSQYKIPSLSYIAGKQKNYKCLTRKNTKFLTKTVVLSPSLTLKYCEDYLVLLTTYYYCKICC